MAMYEILRKTHGSTEENLVPRGTNAGRFAANGVEFLAVPASRHPTSQANRRKKEEYAAHGDVDPVQIYLAYYSELYQVTKQAHNKCQP